MKGEILARGAAPSPGPRAFDREGSGIRMHGAYVCTACMGHMCVQRICVYSVRALQQKLC